MEIRFFAGAAEAAGVDSVQIDAAGATAAGIVNRIGGGNDRLARVLAVSSLLADGVRVQSPDDDLSDVDTLDVLPPFAGG